MASRHKIVVAAVAFELGLGMLGWAVAAWFDVPVAPRLAVSTTVAVRALVALAPMLALLAFGLRTRWPPLVRLREQVESLVRQLFGSVPWWGLAAVALAAGVGEELLFRGALQPVAERWMGATLGLIVISLLFGALHAASIAYFVLAAGVGFYLGWLAQCFDDLMAPIAVHAVYDFAALIALVRPQGLWQTGPLSEGSLPTSNLRE